MRYRTRIDRWKEQRAEQNLILAVELFFEKIPLMKWSLILVISRNRFLNTFNPCAIRMKSVWNPYEIRMKSVWNLHEIRVKSLRICTAVFCTIYQMSSSGLPKLVTFPFNRSTRFCWALRGSYSTRFCRLPYTFYVVYPGNIDFCNFQKIILQY